MVSKDDLPLDWKGQGRKILARDGRKCRDCGEEDGYLYLEQVGKNFRLEDLQISCDDCCSEEWKESFARVQTPGEDEELGGSEGGRVSNDSMERDSDDVVGSSNGEEVSSGSVEASVREGSVGGGVFDWLFSSPSKGAGVEAYPDNGGYRSFWYPWYWVRWMVGIVMMLGVLGLLVGSAVIGLDAMGVMSGGELVGMLGVLGLWEWLLVLFTVTYLPYLMRRDYGDKEWPFERWIPVSESVVRGVVEMCIVGLCGLGMIMWSVWGGEGVLMRGVGEVVLFAGLVGLMLRVNYVSVRGVLYGEYQGRAFVWEWLVRVGVLSYVLGLTGMVRLDAWTVGGVVIGVGLLFSAWVWNAGVRWEEPDMIGEEGPLERLWNQLRFRVIDPVSMRVGGAWSVISRAVRGESPHNNGDGEVVEE